MNMFECDECQQPKPLEWKPLAFGRLVFEL
jgi:hypothetical protein